MGEGGDEVTVAAFISSQRTEHGVPHAVTCRALGLSESWYYKWRDRQPTARQQRRAELAVKIREIFDASGGTYGSPRVTFELQAAGWRVGENTVARLMAEFGRAGRKPKRRRNLTRQGKRPVAPDRVNRKFGAPAPDVLWCGDMTEIVTDQGKLYLATVIDLFSRRLLGYAMSEHHDAELIVASLNMAAAESFNSTIKVEYIHRHRFTTRAEARLKISTWIVDFYNLPRRHSTCDGMSPIDYERFMAEAKRAEAA
jgi:putative transposase